MQHADGAIKIITSAQLFSDVNCILLFNKHTM